MRYSLWMIFLLLHSQLGISESTCYGTTARGRLERGVQLPGKGRNFASYSKVAEMLGRNFVHSTVRKIVIAAYKDLEARQPGKVFRYGETGFRRGGRFRPHKTHQNGLSVDFMVPVLDRRSRSVYLPSSYSNRFGYAIEFDRHGRSGGYRIDFTAMAAHLVSLDRAARAHGARLWRVIFDPALQPYLLNTKYGAYLKSRIRFSTKRSWVRHDEHYHVDFAIRCRK